MTFFRMSTSKAKGNKLILFLIVISISVFALAKPLKYRFPAGDVRKELPNYLKKDGFYHPLKDAKGTIVSESRLNELGILVLVPATPSTGKIITKSHGELIAGKWLEIIDEEKTAEEIAAETLAKKLAQTVFDRMDILDALDTADKTALLTALVNNAEFLAFWSASKNGVDLKHPVCIAALTALGWDEAKINTIKLKILGE